MLIMCGPLWASAPQTPLIWYYPTYRLLYLGWRIATFRPTHPPSIIHHCMDTYLVKANYVKASLQWPGLSDQWTLLLTETYLQCQKRSPYETYKGRGAFLFLFVSKRSEMVQPVPTKTFLQPPKTAAMCTACHDYAHPPPSIPPFC